MTDLAKKIRKAVEACLDNRSGLGWNEHVDRSTLSGIRTEIEGAIDAVLAVEVPNHNISREADHECG